VEFDSLYTNTVIVTPSGRRPSAGRVRHGAHADAIARSLGLDRTGAQVNFVQPDEMPTIRLTSDGAADLRLGPIPASLEVEEARRVGSFEHTGDGAGEGRRVGIGLATYVEAPASAVRGATC